MGTAHAAIATQGGQWKFVPLSDSELLWLIPAGMSLLPLTNSPRTFSTHPRMDARQEGPPASLSLVLFLPVRKIHGGF